MSNLSNLHISGSYKGLINLADSTQGLPTQTGDINLQDGLGNNIGVKINASSNKVTIDNDLRVDGNTDLNGNLDISGSLTFQGDLDVQGNISATIGTFDTINTRLLHVTEESASVIISSGSNVIGDETSDTQTIVGQTTISGSLSLLNGTNLTVDGNISSSTVSGIGNVTQYSSSVDSRFTQIELTTQSLDNKVNSLINVTGSYATTGSNTFVGDNVFSGSVNGEVNNLIISSQTSSLDLSNGNFFTLELVSGSTTHLVTSNIQAGQTITVKIQQPSTGYGTLTFNNTFKFKDGNVYVPTAQADAIDILTLVTYDQTNVFGTIIKNFE